MFLRRALKALLSCSGQLKIISYKVVSNYHSQMIFRVNERSKKYKAAKPRS